MLNSPSSVSHSIVLGMPATASAPLTSVCSLLTCTSTALASHMWHACSARGAGSVGS